MKRDPGLLLAVVALFCLGLIMIFSTTSADILDHSRSNSLYEAAFRQVLYGAVALAAGASLVQIGWRRCLSYSPYILAVLSFLLVLVLVPGIGKSVNGSKRWLSLAGFSFQPSEFVKYVIPLFFIERCGRQEMTLRYFLKTLGFVAIPLLLILLEPNNGTVFVILSVLIALFFVLGLRSVFWVPPLLIVFLVSGALAWRLDYVNKRLDVWLHPEKDLLGRGHQPYQAKVAAGTGGFFGRGMGNSLQKLSYLPEAQNDYIAAILAEELGFLGIGLLIGLYGFILTRAYAITSYQSSKEAIAIGTVALFLPAFQAFLNLAVVSGILPSTGLNLPFFSQGGSSLVANGMGIGLLWSLGQERIRISCSS